MILVIVNVLSSSVRSQQILTTQISEIRNIRGIHEEGDKEPVFVIFDVIDGIDDRWCGVNGERLGVAHSEGKRTKLNVADGSHRHVILII